MTSRQAGLERLTLRHYSDQPLFKVRSVRQVNDGHAHQIGKPRGLWVSVVGPCDWAEWCKEQNFRDLGKQRAFDITLKPGANVLFVNTKRRFDAFAKEYHWKDDSILGRLAKLIDWKKVAKDYGGIVISPYVWDRGHGNFWYYGWDCASGCVWDSKVVATIMEVNDHG